MSATVSTSWGDPDILRDGESLAGLSVRDVIDRQADKRGEKAFCLFPETGERLSYADLKAKAAQYAAFLKAHGIASGQSVAYMGGNGFGSMISLLGCLYGGFRWTPINLVSGPDAISYVLDHSEAHVVVLDPEQRDLWASVKAAGAPDLKIIDSPRDSGPDMTSITGDVFNGHDAVQPNSTGLLMYTSGTTGRPKGVCLTHTNLLAGGDNTRIAHQLTPEDRTLCVLPLYHINAYCVTVMAPLLSGGSVVLPHRFSIGKFWSWMDGYECSWASVVPTLISYLLQDQGGPQSRNGRLRFMRSASAPLAPETHRKFESRFNIPMIETMGLTETAAQVLSNPLPPGECKIGSPGIAFGNSIRISSDDGTVCAPNVIGEIQIQGENVLREYLKNPEATADAFTKDNWFRSGDLGYMDEDGYVFVTGRLKELIIKGGENISPREIDDVLYSHPSIIEAAAIAAPDEHYGQTVEACVVLNGQDCSEEELIEFCRDKLGAYKAPIRVHFQEDLPKGPSGKIQRMKLSKMLYP